jgi:hypothetical protein
LLLHRLFFINEDRTKYVSVGFYPAPDYLPLVEFGFLRRCGDPKTSSSVMNSWTLWQRPCPRYGKSCVLAKLGVVGVRVVPSGWMLH